MSAVQVEPHQPAVLSTTDESRAIVLSLPAGERLGEHEVHERAWVVVAAGEVEISALEGERVDAGAGHLFEFDPGERHEVVARSDARLLILLTPLARRWASGSDDPGAEGQRAGASGEPRTRLSRNEAASARGRPRLWYSFAYLNEIPRRTR